MKNVIIFHGTAETKESFWFPWLISNLEKQGYSVSFPILPDSDHPDLEKWLPIALSQTYTPETIVIGHSAGCPLILSVLERIDIQIQKAILVAGFVDELESFKEPILQASYNWKKIKQSSRDFFFINSTNDPWGCTDRQGRKMFDNLGGTLIVNNDGHMGSDTFNQPYETFPILLNLVTL